jgi:hypothetical protein
MCHVWYFGGKEGESDFGICPGCGEEGQEVSPIEKGNIHRLWHREELT